MPCGVSSIPTRARVCSSFYNTDHRIQGSDPCEALIYFLQSPLAEFLKTAVQKPSGKGEIHDIEDEADEQFLRVYFPGCDHFAASLEHIRDGDALPDRLRPVRQGREWIKCRGKRGDDENGCPRERLHFSAKAQDEPHDEKPEPPSGHDEQKAERNEKKAESKQINCVQHTCKSDGKGKTHDGFYKAQR